LRDKDDAYEQRPGSEIRGAVLVYAAPVPLQGGPDAIPGASRPEILGHGVRREGSR